MHESVEALVGLFMAFVGEVEGDHGGFESRVSQVLLDETGVEAGFKQMRGVRMPQGMDSHAHFGNAGTLCGLTEGALDAGPTHRGGGRRALLLIAPGGGEEPGRVSMRFPIGSQESQGVLGQGDVAVFGALASVDMDLEALAIDIGDLKVEGFVQPESQARDGGEGDLVVQGCGRREETSDLLGTEEGWESVFGLRANERQGVPVAFEDVLVEESDATGADAHGSWGKAIAVFAVQEVGLKLLFGDHVGRFAIALSQQAYRTDIGLLGTLPLATELKHSDHLLTQWGHEISPFVR